MAKFTSPQGSDTQKFANMYHNQAVALSLPDPESVVIIEGEAHVADRATIDVLADYFYHKYEWDFRYDDSTTWRLIEVTRSKFWCGAMVMMRWRAFAYSKNTYEKVANSYENPTFGR